MNSWPDPECDYHRNSTLHRAEHLSYQRATMARAELHDCEISYDYAYVFGQPTIDAIDAIGTARAAFNAARDRWRDAVCAILSASAQGGST